MKKTHAIFAFVALTVLLTAGAAQSLAGSNTVFSDDIVDGQVKFADIKPDAVTSSRIRTDAVGASEIRADNVGSSEIAADAVGSSEIAPDAVGSSEIAANAVGSSEIASSVVGNSELGTITQRSATSAVIGPGANGSVTASCVGGEQFLSGGNDGFFGQFVVASRQSGNGWAVFVTNTTGANTSVTAHVYCLQP